MNMKKYSGLMPTTGNQPKPASSHPHFLDENVNYWLSNRWTVLLIVLVLILEKSNLRLFLLISISYSSWSEVGPRSRPVIDIEEDETRADKAKTFDDL